MGQANSGGIGRDRPAELGASPGRAQLAQTKTVTAGSEPPTAPTRVPVDVEIELSPSIPMEKEDLDVEEKTNISDYQY
jgi:hypothetical protein